MADGWDLPEQPGARFKQEGSEGQLRAKDREVQDFLQDIADMSNEGNFRWAQDTLDGIHESVEKKHFVTEGQRRAIENIRNATRRRRY